MERKILVEVTEEEYQKIKDGIFEKELQKNITKVKEVPVIMDNRFKFSIGDKVNIANYDGTKQEGKVVGVSLTTRPPFEIVKTDEMVSIYIIEYNEDGFTYISQFRENDITLISKENTDESK